MSVPLSKRTVPRREHRGAECGSLQSRVRQGSRAFLLFVIIPPSICTTAFGGDTKQQERVDRVLETLLVNSEALYEIVTVWGTDFFSVASGQVYNLSEIWGDYGHPLAASLCLPTDFHSSYCATPGSVHVTSVGEKVPHACECYDGSFHFLHNVGWLVGALLRLWHTWNSFDWISTRDEQLCSLINMPKVQECRHKNARREVTTNAKFLFGKKHPITWLQSVSGISEQGWIKNSEALVPDS